MNLGILYLSSIIVNNLIIQKKEIESMFNCDDLVARKLTYKNNLSSKSKSYIKEFYVGLGKKNIKNFLILSMPIINYIYMSLRYPEINEEMNQNIINLIEKVNNQEKIIREENRKLINNIFNVNIEDPISEIDLFKLVSDFNLEDQTFRYIVENKISDLYGSKTIKKIRSLTKKFQ